MILLPIFLAIFTGVGILWIFRQYRFLNIFEQIALGFGTALSLFVFELTLQGLFLNNLSLLFPVITFAGVIGWLIYLQIKNRIFSEIGASILETFSLIGKQFSDMHIVKKILSICIIIYVIFKVFMAFSINVSMPTFDEDAVGGWDMKTKVFTENKSLVLNTTSPEFLWSALERNIFAPLSDVYFLLGYEQFPVGLSNIISPLVYIALVILFFWIFLRKTNLFFAFLSIYIFTSLPFIFVHSFASYFNYISGFFLFTFAFYLSDQIFSLEKNKLPNLLMIPILGIFSFLDSSIRNESIILVLIIFCVEVWVYFFHKRGEWNLKKYFFYIWALSGIAVSLLLNMIIGNMSPQKVADVSGFIWGWIVSNFFENITRPGVLSAPFSQSFFHSDYNLLYLLFALSILLFIFFFKKMWEIQSLFFACIVLFGIFTGILLANVEWLWLLTHFSFIRYPIAIMPFVVYLIVRSFYIFSTKIND